MKINTDTEIRFSGLYVSKSIRGYQNVIAKNISDKLLRKTVSGKSYIEEIKNLGYDVLITTPELNNPEAVRISIIKDMNSKKLSDDTYDTLDLKIIKEEAYGYFSPEAFLAEVKYRTENSLFNLKKFFKNLF